MCCFVFICAVSVYLSVWGFPFVLLNVRFVFVAILLRCLRDVVYVRLSLSVIAICVCVIVCLCLLCLSCLCVVVYVIENRVCACVACFVCRFCCVCVF